MADKCFKYWFQTKGKQNQRKGILYDLKTCGAEISIDGFEDGENIMVISALIKGDEQDFHAKFRKRDAFNKLVKFEEVDLSVPMPF
jgi:hypothetical protein